MTKDLKRVIICFHAAFIVDLVYFFNNFLDISLYIIPSLRNFLHMSAKVVKSKGFYLFIFLTFDLKVIEMVPSHSLNQSHQFVIETVQHFLLSLIMVAHFSGLDDFVFVLESHNAFE